MSFIREMMTLRAELRRNNAAADPHGNPGKPEWTLIKDGVQCYVWSTSRQRVMDNKVAEVEEIKAAFPKGFDIRSFDRIEQFKNRKGDVLMSGPFEVLTVTERHDGASVSHLEVKLRRVH